MIENVARDTHNRLHIDPLYDRERGKRHITAYISIRCMIENVARDTHNRLHIDPLYDRERGKRHITTHTPIRSIFDLHLDINSEDRLRTKLYDKRGDFNFPIANSPFMCSNITKTPAYEVHISQLIRCSRSCGSYRDFLDEGLLLSRRFVLGLGYCWLSWCHHFESFMVVTMTWLTGTEYLCHR